MATENLSINSVKARNKKHALEKIVADVAINMTKANAQLRKDMFKMLQVQSFCHRLPVKKPR